MIKPGFTSFLKESNYDYSKAKNYSQVYDKIIEENLFDEELYYKLYPELKKQNPLFHYLFQGYREERIPSLYFDGNKYLEEYSDVTGNPLVHYVMYGKDEGRLCFDTQIIVNYNKILETNKLFLNDYSFDFEPLVSIIILNKDGLTHLKRLFNDFDSKTGYSNYEIIVVDNNSQDDSIQFLESLKDVLPLKIIRNTCNLSFSKANNQAVDMANGDFVLLLNNDMEPTSGWLNEMMGTFLFNENVGAVGAKLVYPFYYNSEDTFKSYHIQHAGDMFTETMEPCCAAAYNKSKYETVFDNSVNRMKPVVAVTAACVLIEKTTYNLLGGLDEDYFYGFEDVDFMLKLNREGLNVLYCPTALLFHHESSTRIKDEKAYNKDVDKNTKVFWTKHGEKFTKEIYKDKIDNKKFITEDPLKFTLLIEDLTVDSNEYSLMSNLTKELNSSGYNVELLTLNSLQRTSDDADVILSFSKNYPIENLKSRRNAIKILVCDDIKESKDYDIILETRLVSFENLIKQIEKIVE